jgi:hypothetical protein
VVRRLSKPDAYVELPLESTDPSVDLRPLSGVVPGSLQLASSAAEVAIWCGFHRRSLVIVGTFADFERDYSLTRIPISGCIDTSAKMKPGGNTMWPQILMACALPNRTIHIVFLEFTIDSIRCCANASSSFSCHPSTNHF